MCRAHLHLRTSILGGMLDVSAYRNLLTGDTQLIVDGRAGLLAVSSSNQFSVSGFSVDMTRLPFSFGQVSTIPMPCLMLPALRAP